MSIFCKVAVLVNSNYIASSKGKTLFVLQDLAPLSQKKGYIPVYASLWQNINAPHEGLITALEEAISALEAKSTLKRLLNSKVKKTSVSNELLGKMEIEFSDKPEKPSSKELAYLEQLLTGLEKKAGKKKILLLIDEVQHLATSSLFEPLSHALRTMLDKRQGKVKSVFTGSSRHYLQLLLNESNSPFYHFVEQYPFPELGEPFIAFLVDKLHKDYHVSVEADQLFCAFQNIERSPYWMMKLVAQILTQKASIEEALELTHQLMEATENFEGISKQFKPIDHLIFLALCEGQNPFSQKMMKEIADKTPVKGIPSNVQRSIKRLTEWHLISQTHDGKYYIEKPGLKHYLEKGKKALTQ